MCLDKRKIPYLPNTNGDRLLTADDSEMQVIGNLKLIGAFGKTRKEMDCLVTKDLGDEAIVSWFDAQDVGAIKISDNSERLFRITMKNKEKPSSTPEVARNTPVTQPLCETPNTQLDSQSTARTAQEVARDSVTQPPCTPTSNPQNHLSPEDKSKIDNKVEEWYIEFPILSDQLSENPMTGPAMIIRRDPSKSGTQPPKAGQSILIPEHLQPLGEELINKLLRDGVIRRVDRSSPSEFCARAFVVEKPGGVQNGVRLVIDFSIANAWILRPVHPFTAGPDLLKKVPSSAKYFCKMDALMGYYQIALHEDSQSITRFIYENYTYEYLRAPMGLNASGDEFCRRSDDAVAHLPGVLKLVDDILIFSSNLEELFERVENVLRACTEHNITLSRKKLEIGSCVTFAGFQVSDAGRHPTPE